MIQGRPVEEYPCGILRDILTGDMASSSQPWHGSCGGLRVDYLLDSGNHL